MADSWSRWILEVPIRATQDGSPSRPEPTLGLPARMPAASGFWLLTPRQPLTPAPHAVIAANALTLEGQSGSFYRNAGNLTAGTIPDSRLPTTLARTDQPVTFLSSLTAAAFSGSGGTITNLNASNISSGLLAAARGGTGADTSGAAAGQVLKWNGSAWLPGTDVGSVHPLTLGTTTNAQTLYVINNGTGDGIAGVAIGAAGRAGVYGLNTFPGGRGVEGNANAGTNPIGVLGESTSSTGRGIQGIANGASGIGVLGTTTGASGFGVQGIAFSPGGYGVVGTASGGASAGLFEGNVRINGNLTFDPKTRYIAISPIDIYNQANGNSEITHSPVTGFTSYRVFLRSGAAAGLGSMQGLSLHLPNGAQLSDATITYNTPNALAWIRMKLLRFSRADGTVTTIGNSSGDNLGSGVITFTTPATPALPVIDNSLYSYAIGLEGVTEAGGPSGSSLQIMGIRVRYFVTEPLP